MNSQQVLIQIPILKKASFLTHARCGNGACEYYGCFFEKPIIRCPVCNFSLRQVPRKRKFKEQYLLNMSKIEKIRKSKREWSKRNQKRKTISQKISYHKNPEPYKKSSKKWKDSHKERISQYNREHYLKRKMMKDGKRTES